MQCVISVHMVSLRALARRGNCTVRNTDLHSTITITLFTRSSTEPNSRHARTAEGFPKVDLSYFV